MLVFGVFVDDVGGVVYGASAVGVVVDGVGRCGIVVTGVGCDGGIGAW